METRSLKTSSLRSRPSLVRAALIFGAVLFASVGIGLWIGSVGPEETASPGARTGSVSAAPPAPATPFRPARVDEPEAATPATPPDTPVELAAAPAEEAVPEPSAGGARPVSYDEAEAAYFAGEYAKAAALFARYTESRPGNAWGHYMAGLSFRKAGDPASAEEAFRHALEIDPDHGKTLVNLGRTLLDAGRAEEALVCATRAVEGDASSVDAHRVRGRALHTLGRPAEALEAYGAALAIDPGDAWSLNNTGLILIEGERFDEAVEVLQEACEAGTTEAVFRNNLGIALERTGRHGEAVRSFTEALALDEGYDKARASLARVQTLAGAEAQGEVELAAPEEDDGAGDGSAPASQAPEIAANVEERVEP